MTASHGYFQTWENSYPYASCQLHQFQVFLQPAATLFALTVFSSGRENLPLLKPWLAGSNSEQVHPLE